MSTTTDKRATNACDDTAAFAALFDRSPVTVEPARSAGCALVASLPHSGLWLPSAIAGAMHPTYRAFLPHQDWHLRTLYDFLPALGVETVAAEYSRYVVDPNRRLQEPHFGRFWKSVASETTPKGDALYEVLPDESQIEARVRRVYQPYHETLDRALARRVSRFGYAYLLDLHSYGLAEHTVVSLGDASGQSCDEAFIELVESAFAAADMPVTRNKPFNGGHITRHYGALPNVQALQIELPYCLYLDADDLDKTVVPRLGVPTFRAFRAQLRPVMNTIVAGLERLGGDVPAASTGPGVQSDE
ncbi:MAG: N-formylglutamate amidohydrolase [Pseudomonadota bacterium]